MRRALIIASNEICYNPRLLKAADYLLARGVEVVVFNTVVGLAPGGLYNECVHSRQWTVTGPDISKRTFASLVTWLLCSIASRLCRYAWRVGMRSGFPLLWNRGLVAFPRRIGPFDLILVNLVDNLPFAALLRRQHKCMLVYDSQELFSGQSVEGDSELRRWVNTAERDFIGDAAVVMTTTDAMAKRLVALYGLTQPVVRVRNAPLHAPLPMAIADTSVVPGPLKLVWHGFAIHYQGRGVNRVLEAIALCTASVELTLQGHLSEEQRRIITTAAEHLGILQKIRFVPPAHPERIVPSLIGYHVGVIGETGADENQRLTSSNKLFEYMHAGLAVIAPDLPGLVETVETQGVGLVFQADSAADLASRIDHLAVNRDELTGYRRRALVVAQEINWSADFAAVWRAAEAGLGTGIQAANGAPIHRPDKWVDISAAD